MALSPATYDPFAAIDTLFPGIVRQGTLWKAASDRAIAKGAPLDSSDVAGILAAANMLNAAQAVASYVPSTQPNYPTALPAYPTGMPRFSDSNPEPIDDWSIDLGEMKVDPR